MSELIPQIISRYKNEPVGNIIARMKACIGLGKDNQLAKVLGISPQAISKFKKQGHLPSELIIDFALSLQLSVDWIITGEGDMRNRLVINNDPSGEIDDLLLEEVIEVLEELLKSMEKEATPKQKTQMILALYDLAAKSENRTVDKSTALRLVKLMAA